MAKWIFFCTALICLAVIGLAAPVPVSSAPTLDSTPAAVKIVCTRQRINSSAVYNVTGESLGTFIAPDFILTHNHYGSSLGHSPCDTLVITDKAGHSWRWQAADAPMIAINAGTSLIQLPSKLLAPHASLSNATDIRHLLIGTQLTVNYWDDNANRLAQHDFQVVHIEEGIIQLADPGLLINPGDSGGGVYLNGKLIGNTWSINLDSAHRPAGSFNIALLPAQVWSYITS